MDDGTDFPGAHANALELEQLLFAEAGTGASQYPDLFTADQSVVTLEGLSDPFEFPLADSFIASHEDLFQYPDLPAANHSSETSQDAMFTTPTPADTSTTSSAKVPMSRPGAFERRNDGEPLVYRELPSFLPFNQPIPAAATLEDICVQYPNHLRGSYLDAFIQYRWTAIDMFNHLSDRAKHAFRVCGISRVKDFGNRANFLSKRLNGRLSDLTEAEVTALCKAPKIRGCLIDGTEFYGGCKLQGKFHNPAAPPIRTFPQRQNQARRGRASTAAAATKTITINGKDYRLWGSANELGVFKRSMAEHWDRQRGYADVVVSADAVHGLSKDSERNQLILQVADWPADSATETFFSFNNVEDCPTFLNTINDFVAAGVVDILCSSDDTNIGRQLGLARQATIEHVLSVQAARLAKLSELIETLPIDSVNYGVVDHVLSWNGGAVQEFVPSTKASQAPSGGNMSMFQNPAGANMFAADGSVAQVSAEPFEAPPAPRDPFGGNIAASQNPSNPNIFDVYFNSMEADPATQQFGSLPLGSIRPKRAREEPAQQTASLKRARLTQPAVPQGHGHMGSTGPIADPFAVFDGLFATWHNSNIDAAPSLPMIPEDTEMNSGPVYGMANTTGFWGGTLADGNLFSPDVDMGSGFTPEGTLQQNEPGTALLDLAEPTQLSQPISAADVAFTLAPFAEDLAGGFHIEDKLEGVNGQSIENMGLTTENAQGSASSTTAAATDAESWELPVMDDEDEDWLREAISGPRQ